MELRYRKYKRRKVGPCNLCGKTGPLTWDHVPPQGGIQLQSVEIDRVVGHLVSTLASARPERSHDGLKFRTLCTNCNARLGAHYDPALNDFALAVGRFLNSTLEFPSLVHIDARPTAIARAVLGHPLAARLSSTEAFFDPTIRQLVFDSQQPLPTDLNVFYWVHPYAQQIVLRDCLMPLRRGRYSEFQRFGVLKYFPIGYLVTTATEYEGLAALTVWRNEPSSTVVKLPVRFQEVREIYWPEAPAPDNFLFGSEECIESLQAHPGQRLWQQAGN
jgi:hypothetical protein